MLRAFEPRGRFFLFSFVIGYSCKLMHRRKAVGLDGRPVLAFWRSSCNNGAIGGPPNITWNEDELRAEIGRINGDVGRRLALCRARYHRKNATTMICHDHLLAVGGVAPLLVTARLTDQHKCVPLSILPT